MVQFFLETSFFYFSYLIIFEIIVSYIVKYSSFPNLTFIFFYVAFFIFNIYICFFFKLNYIKFLVLILKFYKLRIFYIGFIDVFNYYL